MSNLKILLKSAPKLKIVPQQIVTIYTMYLLKLTSPS